MLVPRHRQFLELETDTFSVEEFLIGIVEVFVRPILNDKLDIVGDANVQVEIMVLVSGPDFIDAGRKKPFWNVPDWLSITQPVLPHIKNLPSNRFRDTDLCN